LLIVVPSAWRPDPLAPAWRSWVVISAIAGRQVEWVESLPGVVGFLLFPPDWWETAADMPIQLTLLQGGSSAFQTGPIAP
jgi:hypothetical protein